jgi:hypothetical protein
MNIGRRMSYASRQARPFRLHVRSSLGVVPWISRRSDLRLDSEFTPHWLQQPALLRLPQPSSAAPPYGFVMTTLEQQAQFSDALSAPVSPVAGKRKASSATAEERARARRIRRRVDPAKRKRVAVACESCKRRKQKVLGHT